MFFPTNQLQGVLQSKNRIVLVIVRESVLSTGGVPAMKPEATAMIRRPRFPIKVQNFSNLATFSVVLFAFYMLIVRHISTSGLFHLLT